MRRERRDDYGPASSTIHEPRQTIHSGRYALAVYAKRTEAVPLHQIRGGASCRRGNRQTTACEGLDYRVLSAIRAMPDMASSISRQHFGPRRPSYYSPLFSSARNAVLLRLHGIQVRPCPDRPTSVQELFEETLLKTARQNCKAISFIEMSRRRY